MFAATVTLAGGTTHPSCRSPRPDKSDRIAWTRGVPVAMCGSRTCPAPGQDGSGTPTRTHCPAAS
ncbi:hypothetical protein WDZ92_50745, partial [Nostoc sp. NIES-2111]